MTSATGKSPRNSRESAPRAGKNARRTDRNRAKKRAEKLRGRRWAHVRGSDSYYSTYGTLSLCGDPGLDGRQIPGAINEDLTSRELYHSQIHTWYHGTIAIEVGTDGTADCDAILDEWYGRPNWLERSEDGFNMSPSIGLIPSTGSGRVLVAYDEPAFPDGAPLPQWNIYRDGIVNGDFERGADPLQDQEAGWWGHGGGGNAEISNGRLRLSNGNNWRRHNRFYVPEDVRAIAFDYQIVTGSSAPYDHLMAFLDDTQVELSSITSPGPTIPLGAAGSLISAEIEIPLSFRGEVVTLTLQTCPNGSSCGEGSTGAVVVDSVLDIDDLQFVEDLPTGDLQFSAVEYNTSEDAGSVSVSVTRTGGSSGQAGVTVTTSGMSAVSPSDYTHTIVPILWTDGDSATKTIAIPIINDTEPENSESFTVTLSNLFGAGLGSPASATVTIQGPNDQPSMPEIAVTVGVGGPNIPDNVGSVNFGTALQGSPTPARTFVVSNVGTADLTTGRPSVPPGYTVIEELDSLIPPGDSDSFTVELSTDFVNVFEGEVSFINNDSNENPYNFTVSGVITATLEPELEVTICDGAVIPNGGGPIDFGTVPQDSTPVAKCIRVRNSGTATLTTDNLAAPAGFAASGLASSIAPGASDDFEVTLLTDAAGSFSGSVSFDCNDPDQTPFSFSVAGTVTPGGTQTHDILVTVAGTEVPDGGSVDFGSLAQGAPSGTRVFRVSNTGTEDLTVNGPFWTTPPGSGQFSITDNQFPGNGVIPSGGHADFTVSLATDTPGAFEAFLLFGTNVPGEDPYNVTVSGTVGVAATPEIEVTICDGAVISNGSGPIDFGTATQGSGPVAKCIRVRNSGTATLTTANLAAPAGFTATGLASSIAPGASDDFEVTLLTDAAGSFSGSVSFDCNDPDQTPFSFTLLGHVSELDLIPPTVTIDQADGQPDPTNAAPILFVAVFSEDVTGFTTDDITLSGTAGATTAEISGGPAIYTVAVSGMTGPGAVVAAIGADRCTDLAGNSNTASTSTDHTIIWDSTAPTVTVNQAPGQADPTSALPIIFTISFSEPIENFVSSDVIVGGTAPGSRSVSLTGGPTEWYAAVSGPTGSGTVTCSVSGQVCTDIAGNGNVASTSSDNSVVWIALSDVWNIR